MKNLIKKYTSLPFEKKTVFNTLFSIIFNGFMAIAKIIIGCISTMYLFALASGGMNLFLMFSKIQVYLGIKFPERKSFSYRNKMMGLFLILAALQYFLIMARPLLFEIENTKYSIFLGISIAFISFVELGISIAGCFNAFGKGHYYRNIKLINLCSAFTAIVLTENALMSFASETDSTLLNSLFGMSVALIIILIAVYIIIAPKISIVDKMHNKYKLIEGKKPVNIDLSKNTFEYQLTFSKFYGNYTYIASITDGVIDGVIVKGKSPIGKWNIWIKILVIVLSEILIFPYAVGALIFHFKSNKFLKKLDNMMIENNFVKMEVKE